MGPGHVRLEVHTGEDVRVFPDRASAVAPGSGGSEAVVVAVAVHIAAGLATTCGGRGIERVTEAIGQLARTEHRVTTVANVGFAFQAAHMRHANFAHQG
ncbi:hypothetical protein D3C78_1095570 [compost metagenome]